MNNTVEKVLCCVTIGDPPNRILTLGKNYEVLYWVNHKHGRDPVVMSDKGKPIIMWSGIFHD